MPGRISSGGLRRRLTIAFTLAVGLSAAALAVGSYFVVRHNLLADSVDTAERQSRRNLAIVPTYLPQGSKELLDAYQRGGGDFQTAGIDRGRPFSVGIVQASALERRYSQDTEVRRGHRERERPQQHPEVGEKLAATHEKE